MWVCILSGWRRKCWIQGWLLNVKFIIIRLCRMREMQTIVTDVRRSVCPSVSLARLGSTCNVRGTFAAAFAKLLWPFVHSLYSSLNNVQKFEICGASVDCGGVANNVCVSATGAWLDWLITLSQKMAGVKLAAKVDSHASFVTTMLLIFLMHVSRTELRLCTKSRQQIPVQMAVLKY